MSNYTEPARIGSAQRSLFAWILLIGFSFNVVWYVSEIVINLIINWLSPGGQSVTLENFLLGTSPNWQFFLKARAVLLALGLLASVAGWAYERRRSRI